MWLAVVALSSEIIKIHFLSEEKGSKEEGAEGGYNSPKGIHMPDFINSLPSSFRAARMTGPIAINEATGTLVKNSHLEMFHSDYKLSQGTNFLK